VRCLAAIKTVNSGSESSMRRTESALRARCDPTFDL
jgi:hypothetical protein